MPGKCGIVNYTALYIENKRVLAEIERALNMPQRAEVLRRVERMLTMQNSKGKIKN